MTKKRISLLLVLCMLLSLLPVSMVAAQDTEEGGEQPASAYIDSKGESNKIGGKSFTISEGQSPYTLTLDTTSGAITTKDVENGLSVSFKVAKTKTEATGGIKVSAYVLDTDTNVAKDDQAKAGITVDSNGSVSGTITDFNAKGKHYLWFCVSIGEPKEDTVFTWYKAPIEVKEVSTPPAFVSGKNTYTMKNASEKAATFTLTSEPAANTSYKVYDAATDGTAFSNITAEAKGTELTLTLPEIPNADKSYYISATEKDKVESSRVAVTVKPYTDPTAEKYTIKFAAGTDASGNMDDATQDKAKSGATTYTLPKCTFTAPNGKVFDKWTVDGTNGVSISGNTLTIPENVAAGTEITVTATWKDDVTAAPVFTSSGSSFQMKAADATEATFTLAPNPAANATYKVYDAENDGNVVSSNVSATGTTLKVTFTTAPSGTSPITYYVSAKEGSKTESARTAITIYLYDASASAMPTFAAGGDTYTMPDADATEATFTLTSDAEATTIYEVYATAADTNTTPVAGITASAKGTTLTLTFTKGVPSSETTYYISATEQDKTASPRAAVTVKPYTAPVTKEYTIQFAAGEGAEGEMEAQTVEKEAEGNTTCTLPDSTFTAPKDKVFDKWTVTATGVSVDGKTLTITADVDTETPIVVTATWKDEPIVSTPKYTIKFAAGEGATGTMPDKTQDKSKSGATTYTLPACTFTAPDGKVFDKWTVTATGVKVDGDTLTIENTVDTKEPIVVTATWKLANTAVAKPDVDVSGVDEDKVDEVTTAAQTIKTENTDGTNPLDEALKEQEEEAKKLLEDVKVDEKSEEYKELQGLDNTVKSAADVTPVVVTYMEVKVTGYKPADTKLTMNIAPQMMVVLTSKKIAEDKTATINTTPGAGQNAVKLDSTKKPVEINKSVTISITLPASFMETVGEAPIYVGHQTDKGRYEYKSDKQEKNGFFTFTNPHGFSPFDFTTESTSKAWIDKVGYEDLSKSLAEVKDGDTIQVVDATTGSADNDNIVGKSFTIQNMDGTAWSGTVTINGTKYTTDSTTGKITVTSSDKPGDNGGNGNNGGSGSGRPAIKPGDKPTTPGTTTPSGGVAGFNDVAASAWYAESVQFVVEKGLFGGVGNGRFAPNENMTRAMMWTVLARYKGVDTSTGSNWYEAARAWAMSQGISDGTMANGNVTREQFVTMLWRLSGEPAVSSPANFTDNGKVSDYAKTAVAWAVSEGIVNGYNDGTFKPQGSATRAEVAKMLTVFCK